MRTFIEIFFACIAVIALAVIFSGCSSDTAERFEPPPKKQVEKKYIAKDKEKSEKNKPPASRPAVPPKYRNINKVVLNYIDGDGFLADANFITRWNILGPFPYKAEKMADNQIKSVLHEVLLENEKKLTGEESAGSLKWQLARFEGVKNPGEINLRKFFKTEKEYLIAYAVTYLECNEDISKLTLYAGGSGYLKIWINHQLVHAYDHLRREGKWDQDVIKDITLKKGYNLIVVKSVAVENSWNFFLRLADADNRPLKFIPVDEPGKSQGKN
ncbi:MAG: hypothetical protein WC082_13420 [Victivallales bacterium]